MTQPGDPRTGSTTALPEHLRARGRRRVGPEGVGGNRRAFAGASWDEALAWTREFYPAAASRHWPEKPIPGLPEFTVRAFENGLIQVQRGDWVSKYSIVFTGKLFEWHRFGRWQPGVGAIVPLEDPNLILEGEAVFFLDWLSRGFRPTSVPAPRRPSPKEREGTIKRIAQEMDVEIPDQILEDLSGILTNLDYINQVVGAVQMFDKLAGPVASGVGAGAGAILSVVGNTIAWIQALDTGYHLHGLEATAYAITHWAFDMPPADPPNMRARYELGHGGANLAGRLERLDQTWRDAFPPVDRALRKAADPIRLSLMLGDNLSTGEAHDRSLALVRLAVKQKAGSKEPQAVLAWAWKAVTESYRSWGESSVLKQIVGERLPWPCPKAKR